jgi:hypothetical protein
LRIIVLASAPAYMNPSVKDRNYAGALKKAGLPRPSDDLEREQLYLQAAPGFARRAREAFGGNFRHIMKSVEDARSQGMAVDLFIISPRYGLITEKDLVLHYCASLTGKPKKYLREYSARHRVRELIADLLKSPSDILTVVANRSELILLHDPQKGFDVGALKTKVVIFSAPSARRDFSAKVEYHPARQVLTRSMLFAQYMDNLTKRTLKEFSR